jgi:hypothetical protein
MTSKIIEKALSACDAEGFDTDPHKTHFATGTQRSKAITTLIANLPLAGFLACKCEYTQYVQDVHAQHAFSYGVGGRK